MGAALIEDLRKRVEHAAASITRCLQQLSQDDVWWRPHPSHNSVANVANLIHHVCGHLWQYVIAGVCVATAEEVDRCLSGLEPGQLLESRHIEGADQTTLPALLSSVVHLRGHANQIRYITRLRLGDTYELAPLR